MSLLPLILTDPVAAGGVGDLLLEDDMEDDETVAITPAWSSYRADTCSSEDDEAPGNPPGDATTRVPTGAPSGCLMSVCSGTTLSSASGAPRSLSMREPVARLEGAISSPASQEVAGAGSGAASSQGSRLGGGDGGGQDGGDSTPVSTGQDRSVTRAQSAPVMEDAAASAV